MSLVLVWPEDNEMRAKIGADLLLYGSAFVTADDFGTYQIRVNPGNMEILIDKDGKPEWYRETYRGQHILHAPKNVWHGRLVVEGE